MEENEILGRLRKVVSARLGVKKEDVLPESRFVEDLGADSLGMVDLAMALEDEFQCKIPDNELEKIQTVSQAVEFLRARPSA